MKPDSNFGGNITTTIVKPCNPSIFEAENLPKWLSHAKKLRDVGSEYL
jgi:hypothetical protein